MRIVVKTMTQTGQEDKYVQNDVTVEFKTMKKLKGNPLAGQLIMKHRVSCNIP